MIKITKITQLCLSQDRYNELYLEWIQLMKKDSNYRLGQHICNHMLSDNETFSKLYYLNNHHIDLFNYIKLI